MRSAVGLLLFSKDTIHSYLVMRKVGLPIKIYDGLKMAARFEETDMIGIVPQGRSTSYDYFLSCLPRMQNCMS